MASNLHRGGDFYGVASYRSREGLSTRQVANSDEIQLRIDHGDLDDEITGLRKQVRQLRNNKQSKFGNYPWENDVDELEMLLEAYFMQIEGTLNKLTMLREYIDDTEDSSIFSVRAANKNQNTHSNKPLSLSRSNSRKAEHSPYRRNPLAEIDQNCIRFQVPLPSNKAANNILSQNEDTKRR